MLIELLVSSCPNSCLNWDAIKDAGNFGIVANNNIYEYLK